MATLYVLVGLPGSGKSHWAHTYADRVGAAVVGSDEVRNDFRADGRDPLDGDVVFAEVEQRTRAHLQADRSVILDATHALRRYRHYAVNLAREQRVPCVAIWFDVPLSAALERNRWRKGDRFGETVVPERVIHELYAHFELPTRAEFDRVVRIIG